MTTIQVESLKRYAVSRNPPGVRVAFSGLEGSVKYVAGYLGYEKTNDLEVSLTQALEEGPLHTFLVSRKVNFGLVNYKSPITYTIFEHLADKLACCAVHRSWLVYIRTYCTYLPYAIGDELSSTLRSKNKRPRGG